MRFRGRIVSLTSDHAVGDLPYGASKGAMDRNTSAAARELAHLGVTCNAIDPGPTDTGWTSEEQKEDTAHVTPLGRVGVPQDCANLVTFLCSAEGGWINGRLLRSDGGLGGQANAPSHAATEGSRVRYTDRRENGQTTDSTRRGNGMLTGIVIDALDVARMDRFWQEATRGRTDGLRLRFEPTATPKAGKNRLHLDLAGGPDWEAEVARLLSLGASRVDIGQGDVPWDVLADPEGNEFCVLRPGHPGVLADSGLVAICLDIAEEDRRAQPDFWRSRADWQAVESHDWGVRLRRRPTSAVSLVMGPPAAPKTARNRLRLEVTRHDGEPGEFLDAAGNEFHVTR